MTPRSTNLAENIMPEKITFFLDSLVSDESRHYVEPGHSCSCFVSCQVAHGPCMQKFFFPAQLHAQCTSWPEVAWCARSDPRHLLTCASRYDVHEYDPSRRGSLSLSLVSGRRARGPAPRQGRLDCSGRRTGGPPRSDPPLMPVSSGSAETRSRTAIRTVCTVLRPAAAC